jgi:cytochrome b
MTIQERVSVSPFWALVQYSTGSGVTVSNVAVSQQDWKADEFVERAENFLNALHETVARVEKLARIAEGKR